MKILKYVFKLTIISIIPLLIFSGCVGLKNNVEMDIIFDNKTPIDKMNLPLISLEGNMKRLIYPRFIEGAFSSFITLNEIQSELGEICLRNNSGDVYGVIKVSHNEKPMYVFMLFSQQNTYVDGVEVEQYMFVDSIVVDKLPFQEDFTELQEGISTLEDVVRIDGGTYFHDVYNDTAIIARSYHRCAENSLVEISYIRDGDILVVETIFSVDDPNAFVKKLLPIDLKLIS